MQLGELQRHNDRTIRLLRASGNLDDQRKAALLLEPASPDSYFQWGFFLEVLQRTEYSEAYVMEPLARHMMEDDPALRERFLEALAKDPELRADPGLRLRWFYEQTPFFDSRYRLYPIAREVF